MYTVINVIKALSGLIETNFPEYPVNDRDIEEGFDRPSYFIDIEETVAEHITQYLIRETCQLKLYFFAENNYHGFLALLQMRSQLLDLLRRPLPVTNDDEDVVVFVETDAVYNRLLNNVLSFLLLFAFLR